MTRFFISRPPSETSPFASPANRTLPARRTAHDALANLYAEGLRKSGSVAALESPNIYQTRESFDVIGADPSSAHLAVRALADIRPLYGVANYFVFDGPLEELDRQVPASLKSGAEVLGAATRIFCTTFRLTDDLRARGLPNAVHLPPPLAIGRGGEASARSRGVSAGGEAALPDPLGGKGRAANGPILYWDATESAEPARDLDLLVGALPRSKASDCELIVGHEAGWKPSARSRAATSANVHCITRPLGDDGKELAAACDIVVRLTPDPGLDLDLIGAVANGALAVVPAGHSADELAGSGAVICYRPDRVASRWTSAVRCPGLASALAGAVQLPLHDEGRGEHARQWLGSRFGIDSFAKRLAAAMRAA